MNNVEGERKIEINSEKAAEGGNIDLTLKSTLLWAGGWSRWPQEAPSSLNCYMIQRKRTKERKHLKMEVSLHGEVTWRKALLFTVKDTARIRKCLETHFLFCSVVRLSGQNFGDTGKTICNKTSKKVLSRRESIGLRKIPSNGYRERKRQEMKTWRVFIQTKQSSGGICY